MLLNTRNQIFIAQRRDASSHAWQMPQGGIDHGEEPRMAALRELKEETSITEVEILEEHPEWLSYDLPKDLQRTLWRGRFAGQRQRWFALRHLGTDYEIQIETAHPEFRNWRWAHPEELPPLAVPFKREIYRQVVEDFRHLWQG
jgi:putative (di)nucleoside polyphosphate hydrolase